jgi:hypothetical protein
VLLHEGDIGLVLSKRGTQQLDEVRDLITAPARQGSLLLEHLPSGRHRWWTFAGGAVNSALALRLGEIGSARVDDLWVETDADVAVPELIRRPVDHSAITAFGAKMAERSDLKFAACLRPDLVAAVVAERLLDEDNLSAMRCWPGLR